MLDWLSTKIDNLWQFCRAFLLSGLTRFVDYLQNLWAAIKAFFVGLWTDTFNFLTELPVLIFEMFLNGISGLFSALSVPAFLQSGAGVLFNNLHPAVLYFLTVSGFFQGLAIFGAGVAFRLLRKIFTLGQW